MAQEIQDQLFVGEVAQKVVIERDGKVLLSRDVGLQKWDSLRAGDFISEKTPKRGLCGK